MPALVHSSPNARRYAGHSLVFHDFLADRAVLLYAPVKGVLNRILAALLATEYQRLLPKLEQVTLKRGQVIYRANEGIEHPLFNLWS